MLTPGESLHDVWFYMTYPCDKNGVSWTYSATVSSAGGTTTGGNATIATRDDISANAGGIVNSAGFGAGAVLGQVLTFSVDYDSAILEASRPCWSNRQAMRISTRAVSK